MSDLVRAAKEVGGVRIGSLFSGYAGLDTARREAAA